MTSKADHDYGFSQGQEWAKTAPQDHIDAVVEAMQMRAVVISVGLPDDGLFFFFTEDGRPVEAAALSPQTPFDAGFLNGVVQYNRHARQSP